VLASLHPEARGRDGQAEQRHGERQERQRVEAAAVRALKALDGNAHDDGRG
jgi:hypothetical protein